MVTVGFIGALMLAGIGRANPLAQRAGEESRTNSAQHTVHRAAVLGADMTFASTPSPLIESWLDKEKGDMAAAAIRGAGVRSLRFSSAGFYSPRGVEATAKIKAENKTTNQYAWFPLDAYADFLVAHDFTTIVGINVEEGPEAARQALDVFLNRGLQSRVVAVELSNEPWLSHRPWLPEEFAERAAGVIDALTPLGMRFALPLTVGSDNNTPTKLSDNEWVTRMLRALSARIDLKKRSDIYGVLHLYSRGMRGKSVDAFNRVVRPFAPGMRYLVTEFNIRLGLEGNPHLTNRYAMEFARKLGEVMSRPEIEAMYTHSVPSHSIVYWSNGRRYATLVGGRDERLAGEAMSRGWHLTPAGRVYELYSRLAWNGDVIDYVGGDNQSYWLVRLRDGREVVTLVNDSAKAIQKKARIAGREVRLSAPAHSIVCLGMNGVEIERLELPY